MRKVSQLVHSRFQEARFGVADQLTVDDELEPEHAVTVKRIDEENRAEFLGAVALAVQRTGRPATPAQA